MHVQVMVRGICPLVEMWKNAIQNQYFAWKRTNLRTGKEQNFLVQAGLRPSVMGTYEIIIPANALPTLLSMMKLDEKNIGATPTFMNKMRMRWLRRLCGVKKIPKKVWKEVAKIPHSIILTNSERGLSHVAVQGVAVHLIGYKKDKYGEMDDPAEKDNFQQELI